MLNSIPVALAAGTVFGFLAGIGVGGGSLLILWLTVILHTEQSQARLINLMFFIPSAVIACVFRWKQGKLDLPRITPAIVTGCLSAALFSFIGMKLEEEILKKMFGVLLLLAGLRELFYRPRNAR